MAAKKVYDYNINSIDEREELDLTRTTLYVYKYQYDLLRDIAYENRSKMSVIVRQAIDQYLESKGKEIIVKEEDNNEEE